MGDLRRRVRDEIIAAAWTSFQEVGVAETRAEDLAAGIGISRSSFYRYFKGIDELVASMGAENGKVILRRAIEKSKDEQSSHLNWTMFVYQSVRCVLEDPLQKIIGDENIKTMQLIYQRRAGGYFEDLMRVIVPSIEKDQERGRLTRAVPAEHLAEWLLRQIWCLTNTPPPGGWIDEELIKYIEMFVLPGVEGGDAISGDSLAIAKKLNNIENILNSIERRIPSFSTAPG